MKKRLIKAHTEKLENRQPAIIHSNCPHGRSQWPCCLRCRSTSARLLRLWVQIPPGTWMPVCCECFVLSGRGLCDELITRSEESYRLWWVVLCDLETSWKRRSSPTGGCCAKYKQTYNLPSRAHVDVNNKMNNKGFNNTVLWWHSGQPCRSEIWNSHSTGYKINYKVIQHDCRSFNNLS